MLGQQRHAVAHAADEVVGSEAGLHRQRSELARAVVEVDGDRRSGDDLDAARRRINGHQDGRRGIGQLGVLGDSGIAPVGQRPDVHPEAEAADRSRPLHNPQQHGSLRLRERADDVRGIGIGIGIGMDKFAGITTGH